MSSDNTTPSTNPTPACVDRARLRADIRALVAQSLTLKRRLRQRWTEPMAEVQQELLLLRRRTTECLVLLAWTRGRLHRAVRPRAGSVPDTQWVYVPIPRSNMLQRIAWTPEAYRDLIVAALYPEYALPSPAVASAEAR